MNTPTHTVCRKYFVGQ